MANESVLDSKYGGLRDTLEELYQDGVISKHEFHCVVIDLLLDELEEVWNKDNY